MWYNKRKVVFERILTFNINNITTEIKKSNTFVGFRYVKMKLKTKKKKNAFGKQPNEKKLQRFASY